MSDMSNIKADGPVVGHRRGYHVNSSAGSAVFIQSHKPIEIAAHVYDPTNTGDVLGRWVEVRLTVEEAKAVAAELIRHAAKYDSDGAYQKDDAAQRARAEVITWDIMSKWEGIER